MPWEGSVYLIDLLASLTLRVFAGLKTCLYEAELQHDKTPVNPVMYLGFL